MIREDFCSEQEAVLIAGVSSRTLLRFSEAGYLTLHTMLDGSRGFIKAQVEEIFGKNSPELPSFAPSEPVAESPDISPPEISSERSSETPQLAPSDASVAEIAPVDSQEADSTKAYSDEIARLTNLLAMQERILDSKDDEIADLRSQRAWLRERIEKLEEKGERDQILLLSETQTIRSLLAYQESRKSTLRQFLEWTGLVRDETRASLPQPKSNDYAPKNSAANLGSRTIEVSKAANSD
jgi:hypothetical protein